MNKKILFGSLVFLAVAAISTFILVSSQKPGSDVCIAELDGIFERTRAAKEAFPAVPEDQIAWLETEEKKLQDLNNSENANFGEKIDQAVKVAKHPHHFAWKTRQNFEILETELQNYKNQFLEYTRQERRFAMAKILFIVRVISRGLDSHMLNSLDSPDNLEKSKNDFKMWFAGLYALENATLTHLTCLVRPDIEP